MLHKESYKKIENRKKIYVMKESFMKMEIAAKQKQLRDKKKEKNNQYLHIFNKTN